jgi:hypothetical protein
VLLESRIQEAILAKKLDPSLSNRILAKRFNIPEATLRRRLKGTSSRSMAHEYRQALSTAEERTLLKWISHLTRAGYPIAPSLAYDMAENIRSQRYQLSTRRKSGLPLRPLGVNWLDNLRADIQKYKASGHERLRTLGTRLLQRKQLQAGLKL